MKSSHSSYFPWLQIFTVMLLVSFLAACGGGSWNPFKKDDEEMAAAETVKPLDVPPDLVKPETNEHYLPPEQQAGAVQAVAAQARLQQQLNGRVAPRWQGVQRMRDGRQSWLLVNATPEQVWPLVGKFLKGRAYSVSRSEPAIGIMETQWRVMDEADGGVQLREQLRVRVESYREPGRSEVFLSAKISEQGAGNGQWSRGLGDDERSVEMLNRLAKYLGASKIDDSVPEPVVANQQAAKGVTAEDVRKEIAEQDAAEKQRIKNKWEEIEDNCVVCPNR